MVFVFQYVETVPFFPDETGLYFVVCGIEQESQGHFEYFGDFEGIRVQSKARGDESHHWGYEVSGRGFVGIEKPDYLDERGFETDFFPGFPQRGRHGSIVDFLGSAPREANLPGMVMEVACAFGEQNV